MNDALTIDASVFVSAFSPTEKSSEQSWRFLAQIRAAGIPVFVPTLMLVEVVASLARKQNNTSLVLGLDGEDPAIELSHLRPPR
jgi:predicted nucleic acid-binding protein